MGWACAACAPRGCLQQEGMAAAAAVGTEAPSGVGVAAAARRAGPKRLWPQAALDLRWGPILLACCLEGEEAARFCSRAECERARLKAASMRCWRPLRHVQEAVQTSKAKDRPIAGLQSSMLCLHEWRSAGTSRTLKHVVQEGWIKRECECRVAFRQGVRGREKNSTGCDGAGR